MANRREWHLRVLVTLYGATSGDFRGSRPLSKLSVSGFSSQRLPGVHLRRSLPLRSRSICIIELDWRIWSTMKKLSGIDISQRWVRNVISSPDTASLIALPVVLLS